MRNSLSLSSSVLALASLLLSIAVACIILEVRYYISSGCFYYWELNGTCSSKKAEGIYRQPVATGESDRCTILTLGGSTTYGLGLTYERTWPYLLQSELRRSCSGCGDLEVLNLGYLGGHLRQITSGLTNLPLTLVPSYHWTTRVESSRGVANFGVKDLGADLIILSPIINDTVPDYFLGEHWSTPVCSWLLRQGSLRALALTHYICEFNLEVRSKMSGDRDAERKFSVVEQFRRRLEDFVAAMRSIDALADVPLVLLSLPTLFTSSEKESDLQLAAGYLGSYDEKELQMQSRHYPTLLAEEHRVMQELASEHELSYLPLYKLFHEIPFRRRLANFSDSVHTSAEGSRLIAEKLLPEILPLVEKHCFNR
ncbi:MAG: SGNH/GDSL hydrolase family protein [Deltaproteobacteria bacterium]|nr:SGNH/GDSL hydrolase family protein [Deltaproteobacteria bacterium]